MTNPRSTPRATGLARSAVVAVVAAVVVVAGVAHAGLPLDRVAAIAVRALSYDRGLKARAGNRVDLLVITTAAAKDASAAAFAALDGVNVQGVPLSVVVTTAGADDLTRVLDDRAADAVFVADGRPDAIAVLSVLAQKRGFLLVVVDRAQLAAGAHLAVVDGGGGKPRLVVSLPATRAARIELGSELLTLAEVLR